MRKLIILLLILSFSLTGCLQRRSYSVPNSKHLHYEVEIKRNTREILSFSYALKGKELHLKLQSIKKCRQIQYKVESISTIETVQYPLARYYFMLGSILAALSLPSYYMAIFKSSGTSSAVHAGIGTGVFLAPGLILGGYGLSKITEESTSIKHIGNMRREISSVEMDCGSGDFKKKKKIDIITKTGPESIGFTDESGLVIINIDKFEPLENEEKKIRYFEVQVDGESLGKIILGNIKSLNSNKNKSPEK